MLYGPFYRVRNPNTQSLRTAIDQVKSAAIWGRTPRGGFEPTVQAYIGQLPDDREGVEFFTSIQPNGSVFAEARWYPSLDARLSIVDHWTVKIGAEIRKTRYSCKET